MDSHTLTILYGQNNLTQQKREDLLFFSNFFYGRKIKKQILFLQRLKNSFQHQPNLNSVVRPERRFFSFTLRFCNESQNLQGCGIENSVILKKRKEIFLSLYLASHFAPTQFSHLLYNKNILTGSQIQSSTITDSEYFLRGS